MNVLLAAGALGFLLGMRHATDADHLVAISTIVAKTRKLGVSWLLGALWGMGHTVTVFAVGAAIILLKVTIPARLGLSMEFAVGVMLVLLGALNLKGYALWRIGVAEVHEHEHDHDGSEGHGHHLPFSAAAKESHAHSHSHPKGMMWLGLARAAGPVQLVRAFVVGLVHGLAGSAAIALLVLATIPTAWGGVVYLLVFGAGTLVGMMLLSALMEASFLWAVRMFRMDVLIRSGTGLLSLCFGLYIMYQIGWVDGLFLQTAHWQPR